MKKIIMAAAALCCMMMSLSSCVNSDNPVETQPQEPESAVKMDDASWGAVKAAFVDNWATEYAAAHE